MVNEIELKPYYEDNTVITFINGVWNKPSGKNTDLERGLTIDCRDECGLFLSASHKTSRTIHLFFYGTGESSAYYPRVFVIADEKSQLNIVEHYIGGASKENFVKGISKIYVGKGACVNHTQLFYEDKHTMLTSSLNVKQEQDSHFSSFMLSIGGDHIKQDLTVDLFGEGASCILNGLYLVGAFEEASYNTRVSHKASFCESKEIYRGVVGKNGKANFNGKIIVEEGAIRSRASLVNKNLMLCEGSEINTKPELEIYNDDVICTHGATVGQLDEQALFYFKSRGIETKEAKELLIAAFMNEEMRHVPEQILPLVEKKRENFLLEGR